MSKSRRGLLAAGLAAAVVGSMGIVWTLNADAAETPDADTAVVVAEASTEPAEPTEEPTAVPPPVLPWGAVPTELDVAEPGANSSKVAAEGADAAPADKSGSLVPEPEFAPKGSSSESDSLETMRTDVVPPAPPGTSKAALAADRKVYFHYTVGTQEAETDGTWANLTIEKPKLAEGDFHTLAEITVQSADEDQKVEVGWNVDRTVNGDSDPHLFVFYWKDDVPTCYNACGFTMYSTTVKPGDTLPVGAQKRFGIQHSGGNWWIAYDSAWIGYFPDSLWDGKYTKGGLVQWFGEVAAASATPCTQMGNGLPASSGTAGRIGSITMTNGPTVSFTPRASYPYSVNPRSDTTFRYGGPVYDEDDKQKPSC